MILTMFSGKLQKGLLKVFYKQGKCWFSNTINIIFANLEVTILHEKQFHKHGQNGELFKKLLKAS
jgi:hypothetical protein